LTNEIPAAREAIVAALRSGYGIDATALESVHHGKDFAARVYRIRTGDPAKGFAVKVRLPNSPRDVAAAIAAYLADIGLPLVVAPIRSHSGASTVRAGSFWITVYPFIDGRSGFEAGMTVARWRALGSFAARLHSTTLPRELAEVVPRETYRPPEIDTIGRVDAEVREPTIDGPAAHEVREHWQAHRDEILALARHAEALGEAVGQRSLPLVLCHADLHTWNVLVDRSGAPWVIDWDEVVLAPKERDLMFTIGGISTEYVDAAATAHFLEGYGEVDVDALALAYYRHAWAVQDIGGYAARVLLDASANDEQRSEAAQILIGLFRPGEILDLAKRSARDLTLLPRPRSADRSASGGQP
jgi:spectinomycin phosphotransferase